MSRIFIFLVGIIAGWFLKESNWEEWMEKLKVYFEPQESPAPPIPLLEEELENTLKNADEVFADPLEKIKGIGPVIKSRLNDSGIYTFAQLAALSPIELEDIVGAGIKRFTDEEAIISEAEKFAR